MFFLFPGIQGVQQFLEEPKYTEVNPGADATLTCKVENIGGECRWQKDGKVRVNEETFYLLPFSCSISWTANCFWLISGLNFDARKFCERTGVRKRAGGRENCKQNADWLRRHEMRKVLSL